MTDVNLRSFVGPDDNGKKVDVGDADGSGYASALKITRQAALLEVTAGTVMGGRDACLDINDRAFSCSTTIEQAKPTGQFAVTVKGEASFQAIKILRLMAHGSVADLCSDDWSDQSHGPTEGIVYYVGTVDDGKPIRVRAFKTKPTVLGAPYVFIFPWPWINPKWLGYPWGKAFEVLRRWGLFRSAANT